MAKKLGGIEFEQLQNEKTLQESIEELHHLHGEIGKFDEIMENSNESKKYLEKKDKLIKKLVKIVDQQWCKPIAQLIKDRQYSKAVESL